MKLALVGKTAFDIRAFQAAASEGGYSLADAIDQRQRSCSYLEKFLLCLACFQAEDAVTIVPEHLFRFVRISVMVVAHVDVLNNALNYLPAAERLIVASNDDDFVVAIVQTSLDEAWRAASDRGAYNGDTLTFFHELYTILEREGLAAVVRRTERARAQVVC